MNPDLYPFIARCPQCQEDRGVNCTKTQAKEGGRINVFAIQCAHSWMLTQEDSDLLRKNSDIFHN